MVTIKKISLKDFPGTKVSEDEYTVRFRVDYSKDDKLFPEDIDALRLLPQLSLRQPFYQLESYNFKGTPRQHFMLEHMLKYLPVVGIDSELARIKQVIVRCKVFNQFKEICPVSTKDLEIYVDKKLIKNPYAKNQHSIMRLRKDEGLEFVANLEWNDEDIIEAHQQVALFPTVRHDPQKKTFVMLLESRGFMPCRDIMAQSCGLMVKKLRRYLISLR